MRGKIPEVQVRLEIPSARSGARHRLTSPARATARTLVCNQERDTNLLDPSDLEDPRESMSGESRELKPLARTRPLGH